MRSNVTVGNGAEAVMVAILDDSGSIVRAGRKLLSMSEPPVLGKEPERSMEAAADVVEATAMAGGGSGWLWWPSYVVVKIERSSAQR